MPCHVSQQIATHAHEQGQITGRDIATEQRQNELLTRYMAMPPNEYPDWLKQEIADYLLLPLWGAAERDVDGFSDDLEGF